MKGPRIVIDRGGGAAPAGAALVVGRRLEDLLIDPPAGDTTPVPGTLWRAKVGRLVPKMGAAFVDLGGGRAGFLREAKGVSGGDVLLVQAISFPEPGKATPVTRRILHKGRTVIHSPDAPGVNVSRQIRDRDERTRLQAAAESALSRLGRDTETGLILRSAAEGAEEDRIAAEVATVLDRAAAVEARSARATGPGPVSDPADERAEAVALREWPAGPVSDEGFEAAGLLDEIEELREPRAGLPSGGWLSVETTRALVAVDVNTAGEFGGSAAISANLEAAKEIPRQLRLRGLGGVIAVDWAPLPKKDRRRVEDGLRTSFRRDPIETTLAGWTPLGLFEIQRKRERRPLAELLPG